MRFIVMIFVLVYLGCQRIGGEWDNPADPTGNNYHKPRIQLLIQSDTVSSGSSIPIRIEITDTNSREIYLVLDDSTSQDTLWIRRDSVFKKPLILDTVFPYKTSKGGSKFVFQAFDEIYLASNLDTLQLLVLDTMLNDSLLGGDSLVPVNSEVILPSLPLGVSQINWSCDSVNAIEAGQIWTIKTPAYPMLLNCKASYIDMGNLVRSSKRFRVLPLALDSLWNIHGPQILYQTRLKWKPGYYTASHEVFGSSDGISFQKMGTTTLDSLLVANLSLSHKYYFYVKSLDNKGNFALSDTLMVQTETPAMMKSVNGASFQMGSLSGDLDERPLQTSTVSDFWMDSSEVSWVEFRTLIGTEKSAICDKCPINFVSWEDAIRFANARSKLYLLDTVYAFTMDGNTLSQIQIRSNVHGFRLPSEAEWEFAVRAGQTAEWFWGADSLLASQYAIWDGTRVQSSCSQKPNTLGIYDLAGNLWEWTENNYSVYTGSNLVLDSIAQISKVIRGGSWKENSLQALRSANRQFAQKTESFDNVGFRLVLK